MDNVELIYENVIYCEPLISILVPTYKRSKFLLEALNSIFNQDSRGVQYEVIIVNNDPDSDMQYLIDRYNNNNIKLYKNKENIGMVRNHNRCAELASGIFIGYLHDDDMLLPNYFRVCSEMLHRDMQCLAMSHSYLVQKNDPQISRFKIKKIIGKVLMFRNFYRKKFRKLDICTIAKSGMNYFFSPSCGTLYNKNLFMNIGMFNAEIPYAYDYEFFIRWNMQYSTFKLTTKTAIYRHEDNASNRLDVLQDFYDSQVKIFNEIDNKEKFGRIIKKHSNNILKMWYHSIDASVGVQLNVSDEVRKYSVYDFFYHFRCLCYYYLNNLDFDDLI